MARIASDSMTSLQPRSSRPSSARQHQQQPRRSDSSGGDCCCSSNYGSSGSRDEEDGAANSAASETPSPPPPPPLPPTFPPSKRRRRFATSVLGVSFLLAVAALFRPVPTGPRPGGPSSYRRTNDDGGRDNSSIVPELPFLEGADGAEWEGRAGAARWMRVRSSGAMHPAMYVPGDGMIYCPIAKVACAEWRKTLRWMLGIPDWDTGPIHDQGKNGIPLLARRKARDIELMMNDDSWLKFVVVRDPADRLLSAFLNKCLGGEWQNCPYTEFMPQRFPGVSKRDAATDTKFRAAINDEPRKVFRDFMLGVQKDVRLRGCKVNSHWRPQHCFCSIARFRESYHVVPFANMSANGGGEPGGSHAEAFPGPCGAAEGVHSEAVQQQPGREGAGCHQQEGEVLFEGGAGSHQDGVRQGLLSLRRVLRGALRFKLGGGGGGESMPDAADPKYVARSWFVSPALALISIACLRCISAVQRPPDET
ncbi:unnamed protein product [Ectocarpus sp. CCAP 1310/34]|nr:unnamed protein product [Ectocarpus sp. CCAP 1310/34]